MPDLAGLEIASGDDPKTDVCGAITLRVELKGGQPSVRKPTLSSTCYLRNGFSHGIDDTLIAETG